MIRSKPSIDLVGLIGQDTPLVKIANVLGRGEEHAGPCPFCGGRDRFRVQPERGLWWCRQCSDGDKWQDGIAYVMKRDNLTFLEACKMLDTPTTPRRSAPAVAQPIKTLSVTPPSAKWQQTAQKLIAHAQTQLWGKNGEKALAYLRESRGLRDDMIIARVLGYSSTDIYTENTHWGLSDGKKVWVSRGIVMPCIDAGTVWYVKVRRPEPGDDLSRYVGECEPKGKYPQVRGSIPSLFGVDSLAGQSVAILVEGEFDAMLLRQEAGDLVGVVTLGSADKGVSSQVISALLPIRRLLVAYDTDAAGRRGGDKLMQLSARMRSIRVPQGKDVTDFYRAGGNLRAWVQFHLDRMGVLAKPAVVDVPVAPCTPDAQPDEKTTDREVFTL